MKNIVKTVLFLFFLSATVTFAQDTIVCKGSRIIRPSKILPPASFMYRSLTESSTLVINVTYDENMSSDQIAAFEYATKIWEHLLSGPRTVKCAVRFQQMADVTTLGNTIRYFYNAGTLPQGNTQYPRALAKQLITSVPEEDYDFEIVFNLNVSFGYSLEGITYDNQYDFVTVALHEIGHGLGFFPTYNVANASGSVGEIGFLANPSGNFPAIYDKSIVSGSNQLYTITNSSQLASYLTGENVQFNGLQAKKANDNQNPKIYAPSIWENGSSISHLDEVTFPASNPHSLMTPGCNFAEVNHNPGSITLGVLKDLGWNVNRLITVEEPNGNSIVVKNGIFKLKWYDNTDQPGELINFRLYKYNGINFTALTNYLNGTNIYSATGYKTYDWLVPSTLEDGKYLIKVEFSGGTPSTIPASHIFSVATAPAAPVPNIQSGTYPETQYITLHTSTQDASIYYTLNGNEPALDGNNNPTGGTILYQNENQVISISTHTQLRAKTFVFFQDGSRVSSSTFIGQYFIEEPLFVEINVVPKIMFKNSVSGGYSDGYLQLGKPGNNTYRAWLKCSLPSNFFPTLKYSKIESAEIIIQNSNTASSQITVGFYDCRYESSWGIDDNWASFSSTNKKGTSTIISNTSKLALPQYFVSKLQERFNAGGGEFWIGLANEDEVSPSKFLNSQSQYETIKISFKYNTKIEQLTDENINLGSIGLFQNNNWVEKIAPIYENFPFGSSLIVRGSQGTISSTGYKYSKWVQPDMLINPQSLSTVNPISLFKIQLGESFKNISIKNNFVEDTQFSNNDNKIWFTDPWLPDNLLSPYGYYNRGNNAVPYNLTSPIEFFSSSLVNYQGVLKGQSSIPVWPQPYYTVKTSELFSGTSAQTGKFHRFCFLGWYASPVTAAEFRFPKSLETPLIFKEDNAVISANYKGTELSDNTGNL